MFGAREAKPEIIYSADEEKANIIISVAKETIFDELASCMKTNPEFDVYKTCFRDLSIYLHNNLEKKFGPYWIVTTGRVAHCFMISTPEPEHEEYFFRFGEIYFEVFKYRDTASQAPEETPDYFDDEDPANLTDVEHILVDNQAEQVSENNSKLEVENVAQKPVQKQQTNEKTDNQKTDSQKKVVKVVEALKTENNLKTDKSSNKTN